MEPLKTNGPPATARVGEFCDEVIAACANPPAGVVASTAAFGIAWSHPTSRSASASPDMRAAVVDAHNALAEDSCTKSAVGWSVSTPCIARSPSISVKQY
jgi:hypothetical protein